MVIPSGSKKVAPSTLHRTSSNQSGLIASEQHPLMMDGYLQILLVRCASKKEMAIELHWHQGL